MLRGTTSVSRTRRLKLAGHSVADVFISLRCNGRARAVLLTYCFLRQFHQTTSATFFCEGFQSGFRYPFGYSTTGLLSCQRDNCVLLLNGWDYTESGRVSQGTPTHPPPNPKGFEGGAEGGEGKIDPPSAGGFRAACLP